MRHAAKGSEAWLVDGLFGNRIMPPKVSQNGPAIRA